MQFSEHWLRELVELPVDTDRLLEQFNLLGLEVDGCEPAAPPFEKVVVGEIVGIGPHPDADKLRVCEVEAGQGSMLQVVCGAPNAAKGLKAPLALTGAVLPGGLNIKKSKLRGVESFGMLCSEAELGLAEKADGLMVLPADAPVGADIRQYLDLDDPVIEIDLTPNRGDCLGMTGLAREAALANNVRFTAASPKPVKPAIDDTFPVALSAPNACPRYAGRVVRNIDAAAKTPLWMVEKLRRGGIRAIHPVVDVTNYVMLETGQPMHAFDLDKVAGGIDVRMSNKSEPLTLLDGSEIKLNEGTLVIADQRQALALAGVMGGADSGVTEATRHIFFESAWFAPEAIMGRAREYGLQTDSSYRFERGVDPERQSVAVERATALLLEIAGGEAGPVTDIREADALPQRPAVVLRPARVSQLLGCDVPAAEIETIVRGLGCQTKKAAKGWRVQPPGYRFDLNIEADLIEEIARVRGYDRIPRRVPSFQPAHPRQSDAVVPLDRIRAFLVDNGYQETVSYSFIDPALQRLIDPKTQPRVLSNPLSADMSTMRTSLLGSLLATLRHNVNRQQKQAALFEIGAGYDTGGDNEIPLLAGLRSGRRLSEAWNVSDEAVDFFDIKGDVERLFLLGGERRLRFEAQTHPALHPGQSARVYLDDRPVGWLGAVHPRIGDELELDVDACVFELRLNALLQGRAPDFSPVSRYPAIRRDLAVVVDENTAWAEVEQCIREAAPDCLKEVRLFDVYAGKGVIPGRKSFAIGLILQEISRTLTDVETETATAEILAALNKSLGATLRE